LDAGTEARMMRLFRRLADEGKSVICITHNVDNVDRSDLVLLLARGKLVYYGPPREAPAYFGVGGLNEIYDRLAEKEPETWERASAASPMHADDVAKRLASGPPPEESVADGKGGLLGPPLSAIRALLPESPSSRLQAPARRRVDRPQRPPLWHQF